MTKLKKETSQNFASGNIELYPNCSEMVFRLSGDFEEIRTQMHNILDWTIGEYTGKYGGGDKEELHPNIKKSSDEIREKIKNAKTLEDFEQIVIEFTCNYETFFKKEDDNNLLVATCNNYDWTNVKKEEVYDLGDDELGGYYGISGYEYYSKKQSIDGYEIYKKDYLEDNENEKDIPIFIFPEKGFKVVDTNSKFIIKGDKIFQINNNGLELVPQIKDEKILNNLKILMNLDSSTSKK